MIRPFPTIDSRDFDQFLARIQSLASGYTPEWNASQDRSTGWGLSRVASHYLDETVKRINGAPHKALVAFLDMLGVSQQSPKPARVPVTFTLSAGAEETVILKKGTVVNGSGEQTVPFITESTLAVSPATLVEVLWVHSMKVFDLEGKPIQGRAEQANRSATTAFLRLPEEAGDSEAAQYQIILNLAVAEGEQQDPLAPHVPNLKWSYSGPEGWQPFRLTDYQNGTFILEKPKGPMALRNLNEMEGIWVKVVLFADPGLWSAANQGNAVFNINNVTIKGPLPLEGFQQLQPLAAVTSDELVAIDLNAPFAPFSQRPELFSGLALALPTNLARPGLPVCLDLQLTEPGTPSEDCHLGWEYHDGLDWRPIPGLIDGTHRFTCHGAVRFTTPTDIAASEYAGRHAAWIRVRILEGDFGAVRFTMTDLKLEEHDDFHAPVAAMVKVSFEPAQYAPGLFSEWDYNGEDVAVTVEAGQLFRAPGPAEPQLFFGLNQLPQKGPCGLFLQLNDSAGEQGQPLTVSYWGDSRWQDLQVEDDTRNLTESGILRFLPPSDMAPRNLAKRKAFWLRLQGGTISAQRQPVKNSWFNAVWAEQLETIAGETLGPTDGTPNQTFSLERTPIHHLEIWVDESELLSLGQKQQMRDEGLYIIDEVPETEESPAPFRVQWKAVPSLALAEPGERVYRYSPATGQVFFGDGIHGQIPPLGDGVIQARYQVSLGATGNLPTGVVADLQTTIPFLDSAINPVPAAGGVDLEETDRAINRGPWMLTHRFRAVTGADFERVAMETNSRIARARMIKGKAGRLKLVLLPYSKSYPCKPSDPLKRQVRDQLLAKGPANLTADDLQITGAFFLRVLVFLQVQVPRLEDAAPTEAAVRAMLGDFLDPLTGRNGSGWDLGQAPTLDEIDQLLQTVPGQVSVSVEKVRLIPESAEGARWHLDRYHSRVSLPAQAMIYHSGGHVIVTRTLS